jgi:EamA domain-containing membrane protein RarD
MYLNSSDTSENMELKSKAHIYLITSLLIGSFTPALLVLAKSTNGAELFFFAALLSIFCGLVLVIKNRKLDVLAKTFKNRKTIFYIALAAILTYVPYEYGIAYAEHFISASLTTVIFRLNPLLMLLFLPIVQGNSLYEQ